MTPFRVFIGVDPRVKIAYTVAAHSLIEHSSIPLAITPLMLNTLPIKRRGLTEFTYSRFLVPYLCGFQGQALFIDSDIVCTGDIAEIIDHLPNPNQSLDGYTNALAVVDTNPAFERAAVMLFNCSHPSNSRLDPEYIETTDDPLHLVRWADSLKLPHRYNFLVGYDDPAWMDGKIPTLIHYTKGLPIWPETVNCAYADHWHEAHKSAMSCTTDFNGLMGGSVHNQPAEPGSASGVPNAVHKPQRP